MEKLLAARLRDGDYNNGSFNNILINALQKNGIKEIDGQDLNDYRPPEKMKWTRPIYQTASIFCAIIN